MVTGLAFGAAAAEDKPTSAITGKIDIKRRFFIGKGFLWLLESNNGRSINPCTLSGYKFLGHVLV